MSYIRAFVPLKHPACARHGLLDALTAKQRHSMYFTLARRLITALRDVPLVRDSVIVIAAEFSNRRALYRGLVELRSVNGRLPPTWKKLKGLDDWWERHISDGQDDAGRVYARLANSERVWDVLISHKSEQSRDIAWLARQ